MVIGAALNAAARLFNHMSDLRAMPVKPEIPSPREHGSPVAFDSYADPNGRFVFSFPKGWTVRHEAGGVHAESKALGCFAAVDPFDRGDMPWEDIQRLAANAGGRLSIAGKAGNRRWGELLLKNLRFRWEGHLWEGEKGGVLLSLCDVIDPGRGRAPEAYVKRTLAAIRRAFRPGGPLPPTS